MFLKKKYIFGKQKDNFVSLLTIQWKKNKEGFNLIEYNLISLQFCGSLTQKKHILTAVISVWRKNFD